MLRPGSLIYLVVQSNGWAGSSVYTAGYGVVMNVPAYRTNCLTSLGATTIANSLGDGEDGTVTVGDGGGVTFGHLGAVGDTDSAAHFNGSGWITILDDNFALDLETGKAFTSGQSE